MGVDTSDTEGIDAYPLCSTLRPRFNFGRDAQFVLLKRNLQDTRQFPGLWHLS